MPQKEKLKRIQENLSLLLRGKSEHIELSLAAVLAGGHILLEGPPGTGKTALAQGLSQSFGDQFRRIQMTSDLLPSDIVGFLRLKPGTTEFEFRKGPIFTHFLLADELNRSNPKTQSALLEGMAESTVTVDGTTHRLPEPFFVIGTQNPFESHGVFPLAESQLDRFMLQLIFDFPNSKDELEVYRLSSSNTIATIQSLLDFSDLLELRKEVKRVRVDDAILEYINEIVRTTRSIPGISSGVSVRGGLHLIAAAQALTFLRGRNFVTPLEVQDLAVPTLAHRLCFKDSVEDSQFKCQAINQVIKQVRAPK